MYILIRNRTSLSKFYLEWWGLDDGDGLDNLLLVDGGAGLLGLADDMGHTGLETNESSQMNWLCWFTTISLFLPLLKAFLRNQYRLVFLS